MPSVLEITRTVLDIAASTASAEDKAKLYEVSNELNRLQSENERLRRKNEKLRKKLKRRKNMERHDGGYYIVCDDGSEEGPVCPECYEAKGYIYLLASSDRGAKCSVCGKRYAGAKASVKGSHMMVG